ncbi:MAG: 4Fe-4S dicluster domain-containing protein [Planctomycetota bacterium]|jgi:formate hydrogenlyase subunit 6/NADH:ubiquinone oxidoreductase subunit I
MYTIKKDQLDVLIKLLRDEGYDVVGPTVRDHAIVYDRLEAVGDLPRGWTQSSDPGRYRLVQREDDYVFGYVVGPHSWKKYVFPPYVRLFSLRKGESDFALVADEPRPPQYAFLGVRSCEIAALNINDRVFSADMPDPYYTAVRSRAFVVAVNCSEPAGTCFCTSMGTGPRCHEGFDLALTELSKSFAVEVGTDNGRKFLEKLKYAHADENAQHLAELMMTSASEHMGRALDTTDLPEILLSNTEHSHWEDVAQRCLACASCTLVCPTCFCSSIEDRTDLTGEHARRYRRWASCFSLEFSYQTGGWSRSSVKGRYRQWLTHKLAGWHEQFGTSGCVGCGRCITWCPVGIDITAEASAIADDVRQSRQRKTALATAEVAP